MDHEDIIRKLELIQATLALAFSDRLEATRTAICTDPVNAAVLEITDDWVASTDLQERVAAKTAMSTRSVRDRLPDLVDRKIIEVRGTERKLEYRRTGLI